MKKGLILLLMLSLFLVSCGSEKLAKNKTFSTFQTVDLEGNEVSEKIFSEKELTMVHFWGSTCGPCLDELSELQKMYEKLPDNVNMIGILADVPKGYEEGIERAKTALEEHKSTYQNLLLDDTLTEYASSLGFTPFTVFVDSDGKILDHVKGAAKSGYIEHFNRLMPNLKWKE